MAGRVRVQVQGGNGKSILLNPNASEGATIGSDFFMADGSLATAAKLLAYLGVSSSSGSGASSANVQWDRILNVPLNITQVAGLTTHGMVERLSDGSWTTVEHAGAKSVLHYDGSNNVFSTIDHTYISDFDAQATADAIAAISVVDSATIDFTYTSGAITGSVLKTLDHTWITDFTSAAQAAVAATYPIPYTDISGLATVAHTGAYSDLSGLPTLLTSPLTTKGDIWGYSSTNARLPVGADGDVLTADSTATLGVKWAAGGGGSGTVTSVGLADTSSTPIYSISGSPVTTSGTLDFALMTQNANLVLAGPTTGGAAEPTFRSIITADILNHNITYAKIQNASTDGVLQVVNGGTPVELSFAGLTAALSVFDSSDQGVVPASGGGTSHFLRADGTWATPAGGSTTLASLTDVNVGTPSTGEILVYNKLGDSKWDAVPNYQPLFQRGASFSGGTTAIIVPANNVPIYIPEDCTIVGVEVLTQGGTGSCVLDIWKVAYTSYPPTSANSITAAAKPTISSGVKYRDTTLTGWTTACSAGDTLLVNLTSTSTFTSIMLVLTFKQVGSTTYDGYTDAQAIAAVEGATIVTATGWTWNPPSGQTAITINSNASGSTPDINVTGNKNGGAYFQVKNTNSGTGATASYTMDNGTHQAAIEMLGTGNSEGEWCTLGTNAPGIRFGFGGGLAAGFITNTAGVIAMTLLGPVAGTQVDMTPDKGSFTVTYVGGTTAPTGTVVWSRQGNEVTFTLPPLSATSNSTGFSYSFSQPVGLPVPARVQNLPVNQLIDGGGTATVGTVLIGNGTITFYKGSSTSAASWSSSGAGKALAANATVTFMLN